MAVEDMLFDIQEFQQRTVDRHALKDLNEFVTKVNQIQITTVQPQLSFQNQLQQRVEEHSNMQASGLSGRIRVIPTSISLQMVGKQLIDCRSQDLLLGKQRLR